MATQKVSVEDAAKEIGCCVEYLRRKMREGVWDLGKVVKPNRNEKKYKYFIFREKLNAFLGL